jgi:primosomal protein N' (replication factor Y) (superfamily II helicase)
VLALLEGEPVLNPAANVPGKMDFPADAFSAVRLLDLMIPPGLSKQADTVFRPNLAPPAGNDKRSPLQQRILDLIQKKGELRGRQLSAAFPHQHWKPAAQALVKSGLILSHPVLPPPTVRPKLVRNVQLSCSPEAAEARLAELGRGAALTRRQAIIHFLLKEPWPVPVAWVYAASGGKMADLQFLAEQGMVILGEIEIWRDSLEASHHEPYLAPTLTPHQQTVWEQIQGTQKSQCVRTAGQTGDAAWRYRFGKNRDLSARRPGSAGYGQAGCHPGSRNRFDSPDLETLRRPVPGPGWYHTLPVVARRAL